uniref:Peptidase M10A and M12B, matrixin and adamalysin n=1 Tax=Magnetospirillum gryphiswaldense TaxID=55518 RepID=A4TV16_9PROT|nr:Peptidase M10A and M12B, matrixin and adamalysin [Magnetospirillum gryphiswaldense MSR-1]
MANIDNGQNGSVSRTPSTGRGAGVPLSQTIDATGAGRVHVPGGDLILTAEYVRSGSDLILVSEDGSRVVIRGYFASETPPDLVGAAGLVIDPALAAKLVGPLAPAQYAQAGGNTGQVAIGTVEVAGGTVQVRHADGSKGTLKQGDTVYQGDQVQTGDGGNVAIVFADKSTFSLGAKGRLVLDELVYDPSAHSGNSQISVVGGSFTFVSGDIAKLAPDAAIVKTPGMTIGIRGTAAGGRVSGEGVQVVLAPEKGGATGQLNITTQSGQSFTINTPGLGLNLSPQGIAQVQQFSPGDVNKMLGNASVGSFSDKIEKGFDGNNTNKPDDAPPPPPNLLQDRTGQDDPTDFNGLSERARAMVTQAMGEMRGQVLSILADVKVELPPLPKPIETVNRDGEVQAALAEVGKLAGQVTGISGVLSHITPNALVQAEFGAGIDAPAGTGGNAERMLAIQELLSGQKWTDINADGSTIITYSFPDNVPVDYAGQIEAGGFSSFSDPQKDAARAALAQWAAAANITFVEVTGDGGEIRFANTTLGPDVAWTYLPGEGQGGDVWIAPDYADNGQLNPGEYGYFTLLHEIGHALGLEHAGDYNGGGSPTNAYDSRLYSIMSYFGGSALEYPLNLQENDIAAIQALYGAKGVDLASYFLGGLSVTLQAGNAGAAWMVSDIDYDGDGVVGDADDNAIDDAVDTFLAAGDLDGDGDTDDDDATVLAEINAVLTAGSDQDGDGDIDADDKIAALTELLDSKTTEINQILTETAGAASTSGLFSSLQVAVAEAKVTVLAAKMEIVAERQEAIQTKITALQSSGDLSQVTLLQSKLEKYQAEAATYKSEAESTASSFSSTSITNKINTLQTQFTRGETAAGVVNAALPVLKSSQKSEVIDAWTSGTAEAREAQLLQARNGTTTALDTAKTSNQTVITDLDDARKVEQPLYLDWQKKLATATVKRDYADGSVKPILDDAGEAVTALDAGSATGTDLALAATKTVNAYAAAGSTRASLLTEALAAAQSAKDSADAGYQAALAEYKTENPAATTAEADKYIEVAAWKTAQLIAADAHTRITNAIAALGSSDESVVMEATTVLVAQSNASLLEVQAYFTDLQTQWQTAYTALDTEADTAEALAAAANTAYSAKHSIVTSLETQATTKMTALLAAYDANTKAQSEWAAAEWYTDYAQGTATNAVRAEIIDAVNLAVTATKQAEDLAQTAKQEATEAEAHVGNLTDSTSDATTAREAANLAIVKYQAAEDARAAAEAALTKSETWRVNTDEMDTIYQAAVKAVGSAAAARAPADAAADAAEAYRDVAATHPVLGRCQRAEGDGGCRRHRCRPRQGGSRRRRRHPVEATGRPSPGRRRRRQGRLQQRHHHQRPRRRPNCRRYRRQQTGRRPGAIGPGQRRRHPHGRRSRRRCRPNRRHRGRHRRRHRPHPGRCRPGRGFQQRAGGHSAISEHRPDQRHQRRLLRHRRQGRPGCRQGAVGGNDRRQPRCQGSGGSGAKHQRRQRQHRRGHQGCRRQCGARCRQDPVRCPAGPAPGQQFHPGR